MNIEREIKVRDAIKYCIENFDSQTATNRIVEFWKDELKLQEQQCNIPRVSNLLCSCEMPAKVKGKNECWRCKRPLKEFLRTER